MWFPRKTIISYEGFKYSRNINLPWIHAVKPQILKSYYSILP